MKRRVIVSGIICRGDELLLGKKAKGRPPYPDVWHLLGGGVHDQEKALELVERGDYDNPYFHDELRREIREEGCVEVTNIRNLCPEYRLTPREAVTKNKHGEDTHYTCLEFLCEYASGTPTPADDIAELQWVKRDQLATVNVTPPSQEMYKELGWL